MKIAHIVSTFPPYQGGMGNVCQNQAKYLSKLGHQVTVFTPKVCLERQEFKPQKLNTFLSIGNASLSFPPVFSLNKFDVLHLHFPFIGFGEQLLFLKKIGFITPPLVLQYHMDLISSGLKGLFFRFYNFTSFLFLLAADKILVSSKDYLTHSKIKKYFLKKEEKFEILPLGVDENRFYPPLKKFRSGQNILFVGSLDKAHYFKGVDILIKAFQKVCFSLPKARLIIVGKGNLRPFFINLSKKLKIEDKIEFADKVGDKELPSYYQKADVFVLPSTSSSEAFGLSSLEAMASGLPIIVSNLPGPRSLVKNNGFLFQPGDVNDLALKIIRILSDRKTREKFGLCSRQLVLKYYSWKKIIYRLSEIYEEIVSNYNSK